MIQGEHSAIFSTFTKLPFGNKIFVSSIFEWPLYIGFCEAQRLIGRVHASRPRGRGFKPHRRHCVVSLRRHINPSLVLVQARETCFYITERLLIGRKESNQTNQT